MGAQKSGTTQLASYLDQHPEICLASPKEPDFFAQHYAKGLDWYKARFEKESACLIDASTSYSCAPLPEELDQDKGRESAYSGVAQRIYDTCPDACFIYIMRNPVDRAYSAYLHQVRAGLESKPFAEATESNTFYLRTGIYAGQLALYLRLFDRARFHFVFFEEFVSQPELQVRACFRFLGLDDSIALHKNVSRNQSFVYSGLLGRLNAQLGRHGGLNRLVKAVKPFIPRKLLESSAAVMTEKPDKLDPVMREKLEQFFKPHDEKLRTLLTTNRLPWP